MEQKSKNTDLIKNKIKKPVAVVLGGTSPHVELINKLRLRGYYVILVDYLDNSPGIAFSDMHIKESTLDAENVLQIAKEYRAELVISACIDQANSICCYVAEKLDLPRPYDYQTSLNVTDKGLMKRIMVQNKIPTSPYMVVTDKEELDWDKIIYPIVVKPADCNSSKGVHRVDSNEDLKKYLQEALRLSRSHQAIVEKFNEGMEIQVDCFASEGEATVLLTRQKKKISDMKDIVLQSTGSLIPAPSALELQDQIRQIANQIADAFHLYNTPFFYQAIVNGSKISVLEFAPRIGGGLSSYLIKTIAGIDLVEAVIDSFLGKQVHVECRYPSYYYSTNLLYMNRGIFNHLEGLDCLKQEGKIKEYFQLKQPGAKIDNDMCSSNRVGAFVVEAASLEKVRHLEKQAYDAIKVIDSSGNDALKRELYIS